MKGGTIKGFVGFYGGAVCVSKGRFNMEGGTIRDCKSFHGAALYIGSRYTNHAQATIGGGSGSPLITNNEATCQGGGIRVESGKLEIKSGRLENNASLGSDESFSGVYYDAELSVGKGTEVLMSGGTIVNNGNSWYAVGVEGKLTVSGSAVLDLKAQRVVVSSKSADNIFFDFDDGYALIQGGYLFSTSRPATLSATNGMRFGKDEDHLAGILWNFDTFTPGQVLPAEYVYVRIAAKRTMTFALAENEPTVLSTQTLIRGDKVARPADPPTRAGYGFDGYWSPAYDNGYVFWDFDNDVLLKDTTLYGIWSGETRTIAFDANGGTLTGETTLTGRVGQTLKDFGTPPEVTAPEHMTFAGWYTAPNGGTKVSEDTLITADMQTLYALYAPQNGYCLYYVYYYDLDETESAWLESRLNLADTDLVGLPSKAAPQKRGKRFVDWYIGDVSYASITNNYADLKTIGDLYRDYGTYDGIFGKVELYARYEDLDGFKIIFRDGDTVFHTSENLSWSDSVLRGVPEPTAREGYTFECWVTAAGDTVTGDTVKYAELAGSGDIPDEVTLYAQWRENTYTVQFDASDISDKTGVKWQDKVLENVAVPVRAGYTFLGWQFEGCDVTADDTYADLAGRDDIATILLTAQWQEKTGYTVAYDTADGTAAAEITDLKWTDKVLENVNDPEREGFVFLGWKCGDKIADADTTYSDLADSDTTVRVTLTAQWRDVEAPTGEIAVGQNRWHEFLNTVTFGLFFRDTQKVTITAADNSGEAVAIKYLLSDKELTEEELAGKTFTAYSAPFNIDPDNMYIVYAKLTDTSGNGTYISSQGIVLDATAPVITGVTDGATYCAAVTVTVTEDHLKRVTVNNETVTPNANGQFTLVPTAGEQRIVAEDLAGNTTVTVVTVNDGHTVGDDDGDCTTPILCIYCGEIAVAAQEHDFGAWTSNGNDSTHTRHCQNKECAAQETESCSGGTATCKDKAKCEVCGESYGELNGSNHTDLIHFPAKAATTASEGNIEYWYCSGCDKYYRDAEATQEIAKADTVTAKLTDEKPAPEKPSSPKTGEGSALVIWAALLCVSIGGAAFAVYTYKRKKQVERQNRI